MSKGFRTRYLMFNFVIIVFAAIITLRRTLLLQEFYSAFSKSLGWKLKHQKNINEAPKTALPHSRNYLSGKKH